MADKKYKGAPFGVQTARFDVSGVHPKSKVPGTFTQMPYCKEFTDPVNIMRGPGKYEVDCGGFNVKSMEEKASGPGWARAYEVSRLAAMPHLLYKDQWELKKLLQKKLGPGSYEHKDFLQATDEKPRSTRGIIDTKEERFKDRSEHRDNPGPGNYGAGGVPHSAVEEKGKKSASTVGLLDNKSSSNRALPTVGSHLGPGNYNFESFTDQIGNKVVSNRGPYDLYSGDRNKPIKTGHYAHPNNANLGPGQYAHTSFTSDWDHPHKSGHGRIGKNQRFPKMPLDRIYCFTLSQKPRDPDDPGPDHYTSHDLTKSVSHAKNSPAFLSSAQRVDRMATKFFTGNFNPVGVGRHDIQKYGEAQHRNGHKYIFNSKSDKPSMEREKFLKERIRGKDVRPEDRVYLVTPDGRSRCNQTHAGLDRSNTQVTFTGQRSQTVM